MCVPMSLPNNLPIHNIMHAGLVAAFFCCPLLPSKSLVRAVPTWVTRTGWTNSHIPLPQRPCRWPDKLHANPRPRAVLPPIYHPPPPLILASLSANTAPLNVKAHPRSTKPPWDLGVPPAIASAVVLINSAVPPNIAQIKKQNIEGTLRCSPGRRIADHNKDSNESSSTIRTLSPHEIRLVGDIWNMTTWRLEQWAPIKKSSETWRKVVVESAPKVANLKQWFEDRK